MQLISVQEAPQSCSGCHNLCLHDMTIALAILPAIFVLKFDEEWIWVNESDKSLAKTRSFSSQILTIKDSSTRKHSYRISSVFCKSSAKGLNPYVCYISNGVNSISWLEFSSKGMRLVPLNSILLLKPLFVTYVRSVRKIASTPIVPDTLSMKETPLIPQEPTWEKKELLPQIISTFPVSNEDDRIQLSQFINLAKSMTSEERNELVINGRMKVISDIDVGSLCATRS